MTDTKEVLDTKVPVRLIGISNKFHTAPVFVCPKFDSVMGTFTVGDKVYKGKRVSDEGVEPVIYSAIDTPINVTNVDSFRLQHLQMFDPSNPSEMFILEMAKGSGFVAASKKDANPGSDHRYYIENKEDEAIQTISKASKIRKALDHISTLSAEKMEDVCRLIGLHVKGMSKTQSQAALEQRAMDKPDDILDVFTDKDKEVKIFLKKLVDKNVITISDRKYYHGKELLGIGEDYAVEFLKDSNNRELVGQLNKLLKD
ncbi:MAG: hypothetical protein ABIW84_01550 [Ilumatobacteraceae bacterium]